MTGKIATASRRRFIATAAAGALALAAPYVRAQTRKSAKISIGRQPWAATT
jgi:hypothetical protein